jgi:transmembrane sensor
MNPPSNHQQVLIKQAIEWHQRLGEGEMDAEARREFNAWLRSPTNAKELARICLIDACLKGAPLKREPLPPLPENVVSFQHYAPASRPRAPQQPVAVAPLSRFKRKSAIAASMFIAVLGAAALVGVFTKDQVMVTREGRWDKQLLDDGSVIHVGPSTTVRVNFDAETRAVTLERGEALFDVAKEADRPFIVTTDAGSVQALGTSFATADRGDEVVVTVATGRVAVTSVAAGAQPMLALGANQQVVLSPIGVSEPMVVNAERELKWVRNWYEYDGEPVSEIIEQLNLRNKVQVIVEDPSVGRLRMSSLAFKPSQPEEFVAKVNRWYADYPQRTGDTLRSEAVALRLQPL